MVLFKYDDEQIELGQRLHRMARGMRESSRRLEDALDAFRDSEASDPLYGLLALAILPAKEDLALEEIGEYQAAEFYHQYREAVEQERYPSSERIIQNNQETPMLLPLANISFELQYKPRGHRIRVDESFITALEITYTMITAQQS